MDVTTVSAMWPSMAVSLSFLLRNNSRAAAEQQQLNSSNSRSYYHAAARGHDQMQQLFDDGTVC